MTPQQRAREALSELGKVGFNMTEQAYILRVGFAAMETAREALGMMADEPSFPVIRDETITIPKKDYEVWMSMMGDEGMVWVRKLPTKEMIDAAVAADPLSCDVPPEDISMIYTRIYEAMINAAKEGA